LPSGNQLFAVVSRRVGKRSRNTLAASVTEGDTWRAAGGPITPRSESAYRPTAFVDHGALCAWFDVIHRKPPARLRLSCLVAGRWTRILSDTRPGDLGRGVKFADTDGAAVADATFAAADRFELDDVDWIVRRRAGTGWRTTNLTAASPTWTEQGRLFSIRDRLYAFEFDQRQTAGSLAARLAVRTLGPDGRARQIGAPLLDTKSLLGPVIYDLAESPGGLVALWASPLPAKRRMEIRVSVTSARAAGL
jgi:hypothetical protein